MSQSLSELKSWKLLQEHASASGMNMREAFASDAKRFQRFSLKKDDLLVDYSKQLVTEETLSLLISLVEETGVLAHRDRLFAGDPVNFTERRAVMHTALRHRGKTPVMVGGEDVMPGVEAVLAKMGKFTDAVLSGDWKGFTGKTITDIVNIGIGGSDLGPLMATEALDAFRKRDLHVHFVSNVDGAHLARTLEGLKAETTLFIIVSKTFTTQETLMNARSARAWTVQKLRDEAAVPRHFVAVSTAAKEVERFGIALENMFEFWDWVGGRFSMWSAVGLSIACAIGMDGFSQMLRGAYEMDEHFRSAKPRENMPMVLALIDLWCGLLGARSHAVIPYDQGLHRFPAYLQQAEMESNGKRTDKYGQTITTYRTSPIVWGEPGTNGQHAFFQLLHQGTELVPCDFIAPMKSQHPIVSPKSSAGPAENHHDTLIANMFAQAEALMVGKTRDEAKQELLRAGMGEERASELAPHKTFSGNRPSTTILFDELSPYALGRLVALYEHKIFVLGSIWAIDSFDQWGVELGKQLAKTIGHEISARKIEQPHDGSTSALIHHYLARLEK